MCTSKRDPYFTLLGIFFCAIAQFSSECGAQSPELTPEQRGRLFGNPQSVKLEHPVGTIDLEGTDLRGFYKCPYLRLFINGSGPFTFLFDTGSGFTLISSNVIKAANISVELDRGGYHDLLRVERLKVGDAEVQGLTAVRDDDFGADGVLGFKAFGDMNLVFKLQEHKLLLSSKPVALPGSFSLPYQLFRNIPTVPVLVGSKEVATLIDTGDDAYGWELRSEDLNGARLKEPPKPAESVLNGAKSSQTYVGTMDGSLKLGPIEIDHPVVGINDSLPVPDFGVDLLVQFNIEFDPKMMTVAFQPRSDKPIKIAGNMNPGFTLRFDSEGTVSAVVPGSAAERAGMASGTKIVKVNGRAVSEYDPRAWDDLIGSAKTIIVRWKKGSVERSDKFYVTELR
jgi:hypothetical protein